MSDTTSLVLSGGADEQLPEFAEIPVQSLPTVIGWASAASAIHSVRRIPTPVLLRLDVVGYGSVAVDFRHHAFHWETPLERFPENPGAVLVETHPTTADAPAPFELPGRDLDGLLWLIGQHAFPTRAATWLWGDDRYRLRRWPNLAELPITLEQVRMTAMLGNAAATPAELAEAVGAPLDVAQGLINAYSLMGILRSAPAEAAPVAQATPERGLFSRLKKRLGWA